MQKRPSGSADLRHVSHRVHGTHSRAEVLSCRSDPLAKSCWEPALPPTEG